MLSFAISVTKSVSLDAVNQSLVPELDTSPHIREVMWALRHRFCAARNHYVGIPGDNSLSCEHNSLDTGRAHFIYSGTDCSMTEAGVESALSGWILAKAGSLVC